MEDEVVSVEFVTLCERQQLQIHHTHVCECLLSSQLIAVEVVKEREEIRTEVLNIN